MNNSLTKHDYCQLIDELKQDESIKIINPLSQDLNALRQAYCFLDSKILLTIQTENLAI